MHHVDIFGNLSTAIKLSMLLPHIFGFKDANGRSHRKAHKGLSSTVQSMCYRTLLSLSTFHISSMYLKCSAAYLVCQFSLRSCQT